MTISPLPFSRARIHPGDRICCAVSGGADSVALLRSLHAANSLPSGSLGVGLSAVHVHHGLRGHGADRDANFVQALCDRLSIPLHLCHVDVPTHAASSGEGTEEAARTLRYQAFQKILNTGAAVSILTAHTLDDQAETVVMKILRGAWTEGLSAIYPILTINNPSPNPTSPSPTTSTTTSPASPHSGRFLRPFLTLRRSHIEAYLRALDQPWCTDETNADPAFTRNRIRHQLLPLLREFNPAIDQTLANLAELAREEEAHWHLELERILPQILLPGKPVRGGGRTVSTAPGEQAIAIELERLRGFNLALQRRILRGAGHTLGLKLNFDETARLLALAGLQQHPAVHARPGSTLHLSHGLRAERSHRELRLYLNNRPPPETSTLSNPADIPSKSHKPPQPS